MIAQNNATKRTWETPRTHYLKAIESPWYKALFSVQNTISRATHTFYEARGIQTMHLPITTGTISSPMGLGSDSSPVEVEISGQKTFLADSMQFLLEYGCRLNAKGVYYLMPSFRGEMADNRHLCQFFHSEVEIPGTLDDIMCLAENYVIYLSKEILTKNHDALALISVEDSHLHAMTERPHPFPRITFQNALELLEKQSPSSCYVFEDSKNGFKSITPKGERFLMDYFGGIVWLKNVEHKSGPFYQAYAADTHYAQNADLLFGIGEVIGSGQRHFNKTDVITALHQHNVHPSDYEWYCTLKERYPLQTSGFGMGIERFLLWVFRHNDIRDMQLLPRFNGQKIYV